MNGVMTLDIDTVSIEELKAGYVEQDDGYRCLACGQQFMHGEVFPVAGRFYDAARAVQLHMQQEHADYLHTLLHSDLKYNTLTEKQQQLLTLFASGLSDADIAKQLGVAASTVRHQKFMFREKAKQAKYYLAQYQNVFDRQGGTQMAPVHDNAKMMDERYVITEEERMQVLKTMFSSLEPMRLKLLSPKEKKKIIILTEIVKQFEAGKQYTEREVNAVLKPIYADFATLRRYLIEYGFMQRTDDCALYWRT